MTITNKYCIYCKNKDLQVKQISFKGNKEIWFVCQCGACNKQFYLVGEVEFKDLRGYPLDIALRDDQENDS